MKKCIKIFILNLIKCLGGFSLCRFLYRKKGRIICYHGFSCDDEHLFRPKLFMKAETFETRIKYLKSKNFKIIDMDLFSKCILKGEALENAVVVTIDDGWDSLYSQALPILKKYQIPSTVYVASETFEKRIPIYFVAIQYFFWKTNKSEFMFNEKKYHLNRETYAKIFEEISYFFRHISSELLNETLERLARSLSVEYLASKNRKFHCISPDNIYELESAGVSIELHTHTHDNPMTQEGLRSELLENMQVLSKYCKNVPKHFCYPSGFYERKQFEVLADLKIQTATTCQPGLVDHHSHRYELNRFVDGEDVSQIEFEAEMSGLFEILRKLKIRLSALRNS